MSAFIPRATTVNGARWLAQRAIDAAAGEARLRFITSVPGQEAVYLLKLQEAQAYLAAHAGDPDADVPPHIAAEATATGQTAVDVATMVVGLASYWNGTISPAIEGARMGGKAAVAAATGVDDEATLAAIEAARAAALAALGSITP